MMKRVAALAAPLLAAEAALAQCPMCRTAAASQGADAARALDFAILILLVPAVGIFCRVYLLALRRDSSPDDAS